MEGSGCCSHHPYPGELPQATGSVVVVVVVVAIAAAAAAVMPGKPEPELEPGPGPLLLMPPLLSRVAEDQEGYVCTYVS